MTPDHTVPPYVLGIIIGIMMIAVIIRDLKN
jgi:hypothetical protein